MATYAYPIPNGKVNSEGLTKLISTLYTGSGVIYEDSLTVSASGTPDMNVVVSGSLKDDVAVFIGEEGIAYTGWNTDDSTVTIDANGSGVSKIDTIVAYIDLTKGDEETANAPGGLSFMAVRGEGTDTQPTDSAIDTAVGHSFWIRLANVTVTNGTSSINSGNITDERTVAGVSGDMLTDESIPFDKTDGIWWEELGRHTLSSSADTLTTSFTAKKFLRVLVFIHPSGQTDAHMTFNGDTGSNYSLRQSVNGGADSTSVSQNDINLHTNNSVSNMYVMNAINYSSTEKILDIERFNIGSSGAGNAPTRVKLLGKWANTSNQISSITVSHSDSGDYAAGSEIVVLGHD